MESTGEAITRQGVLPLYEQLAALIARRIEAGQYASGERLPTELELARDHAISRDTVRQALSILERQGMVVRRRPRGTFVAPQRVSQDLAELRSFQGGLLDRGVVPKMELLEFRPAKPPAHVAAMFGGSETMRLLRRYVVDGKPLAIADLYLHPMARAIAWEIAERHNTFRIFEHFLKVPVARAPAVIRAESAGSATARLLDVRPSSPVLVLLQTHYSASGDVLVASSLRVRPDAYEFRIDLPGGMALNDGLTNGSTSSPKGESDHGP